MPPRQSLPPAQTAAAKEAQKALYCNLCAKGYSRINDYEAHLSSYDHSHKQRLKDMKAMVRDPGAGARARKAEAKADGIVSIKIGDAQPKKGGFKKSGFKSAFGDASAPAKPEAKPVLKDSLVESDTDDEGYEVYDPRYPTD